MHKDLSEGQKQKINLFIEEALTFNKKHNIFVRKSLDEIIEKDVLDCIPLTKKIDKHSSVLDLGSGGGFPGIIASIIKPEAHIDLLEKSQKKCYFLGYLRSQIAVFIFSKTFPFSILNTFADDINDTFTF
mgnify:CR=1 FL=1